ncbi:MAG: glycosyltransferase family A protein [Chlamydiota bacterium]
MKNRKKKKNFFHRLFILFIILLLPTFLIREYKIILAKKDYRILPTREFKEIEISSNKSKSFVFIVLTHNASACIEDNFRSILSQNYPYYRVVYLDRGSTDGTVEQLQQLVAEEKRGKEVLMISEKKESQFFKAYYQLIHDCRDEDVIIHLYGTDWLAHNEVLQCLNQTYSNPGVWLSYGQYLDYPDYKEGRYRPTPQKTVYRKKVQRAPWMKAYLKTFYAGLFKKIEFKKVECSNYFLSIKSERDLLFPLVEMGKAHVQFIPDVLYIHHEEIKKKNKQWRVSLFPSKAQNNIGIAEKLMGTTGGIGRGQVDIILFSRGNLKQLQCCLRALCRHMSGVHEIQVIDTSLEATEGRYGKLQQEFPAVVFLSVHCLPVVNFKQLVLRLLVGENSTAPYVLFATDQAIVREAVNLETCILAMQKTGAYGFYLNFNYPPLKSAIGNGVYSWMIGGGDYKDSLPHPLEMGLYRKVDLEHSFKEMPFIDCASLVELWTKKLPKKRMALSFNQVKIFIIRP